ncbi:Por secretion system C-terminal sorting domain-containing protein [Soonwooa buanensis]|uniref:Por secretion system C-terminal sorting domain-containing protein n=1 Tax=Soonwooa buanensis TaxID=619805 RepID=A0A1T5D3L1_9FLAO|nr:T9SS type A sorting domain-containing protein [Soonwooa buanensis]SKB66275.1 Por secretion system C-terminal sorting domain-containing protein [Soonwooa buanensis]
MKRKLFSVMTLITIAASAQTYDNGSMSTGSTTANGSNPAPTGYNWSELQSVNNLTSTSLGFAAIYNNAGTTNYTIADDFVVPSNEKWTISSIDVFLYQTSYTGTVPPIDNLRLKIYNGDPETATAVLGNMTTNTYNAAQSSDAKLYRIGNNSAGTTRKIWKAKGNLSGELQPGTYWVEYQVHATNDSSIFFPPVTTAGILDKPTYNAKQFASSGWLPLTDAGSGAKIDMPFIITYTATNLGTSETRQYDSRITVYPNPTAESFKINLPEESLNKDTKIELYDASGKLVKTFDLSKEYNISNLKKGIYMIKINDGKNIKVTKLIKN